MRHPPSLRSLVGQSLQRMTHPIARHMRATAPNSSQFNCKTHRSRPENKPLSGQNEMDARMPAHPGHGTAPSRHRRNRLKPCQSRVRRVQSGPRGETGGFFAIPPEHQNSLKKSHDGEDNSSYSYVRWDDACRVPGFASMVFEIIFSFKIKTLNSQHIRRSMTLFPAAERLAAFALSPEIPGPSPSRPYE